jgi:NAD(P)H-dependent FMN reductase
MQDRVLLFIVLNLDRMLNQRNGSVPVVCLHQFDLLDGPAWDEHQVTAGCHRGGVASHNISRTKLQQHKKTMMIIRL